MNVSKYVWLFLLGIALTLIAPWLWASSPILGYVSSGVAFYLGRKIYMENLDKRSEYLGMALLVFSGIVLLTLLYVQFLLNAYISAYKQLKKP